MQRPTMTTKKIQMNSLKDYIEAFTHLHTAKVKGHKAPHKAILLLSIIDLIESEVIRYPQIELTDELIDKFNCIWKRYLGESSIFTPDITKPYFHMQHEPFWKLVEKYDIDAMLVAEDEPWSKNQQEKKNLPSGSYSVKSMRNAFEFAEIDDTLLKLLQNADARAILRVVLINEYLTNQPTKTMPNIISLIMALPIIALVA